MSKTLRWIRALARIESRNIRKNRMRTALIAVMIALPVAAVVGGINLTKVTEITPLERANSRLGSADLLVRNVDELQQLDLELPAGSIVEHISSRRETVIAGGLTVNVVARRMNLDGLARGIANLTTGDSPRSPKEIAITPALKSACRIEIGDAIDFASGDRVDVVGIFEVPEKLDQLAVLFPFDSGLIPSGVSIEQTSALVKLPESSSLDDSAVAKSIDAKCTTRTALLKTQVSDLSLTIFVVGCFALAEAALIVAAAFIVGIRRRQREIGLVASSGGSRKQVVVSILISATMIAFVASLAGAAVGLFVAWLAHPWLDGWNSRRNGEFEIAWASHFFAVVLGVVTAIISAVVPAIGAGRMPIKSALSARRPPEGGSIKWGICGFALVAIALGFLSLVPGLASQAERARGVILFCILGGSIIGLVGLGLCSSTLLGITASLASILPLSWRLAVRELGRFRTRNGPIVTAIIAGMALCVVFASFYQSVRDMAAASQSTFLQDEQLLVNGPSSAQAAEAIVDSLKTSSKIRLVAAKSKGKLLTAGNSIRMISADRIAIVDDGFIAAAKIEDPEGKIEQALLEGFVVSLGDDDTGKLLPIYASDRQNPIAELEVFVANSSTANIGRFGYFVTRSTAESRGWKASNQGGGGTWLLGFSAPIDQATFDRAARIASGFPQTSIDAQLNYEFGRSQLFPLYLISFLTGLIVIAIATTLASVEAKADQQVLKTVGAPPSVYRHQAAARSGFFALIGSTLAIPAGLLPAFGMTCVISQLEFGIPWFEFIAIVIGLPLIAYCSTWLMGSLIDVSKSQVPRLS